MNQNKKYLIFAAAAIVLFIIFVSVIFLQQTPQKQSTASTQSSSPTQQSTSQTQQTAHTAVSTAPSVSLAPPASSPKVATQQFYDYFFSAPKNPLANGEYKTNPYLSSEFKNIIAGAYENGDVPVFCTQNKSGNIVVDKEQSVYYNNSYLMEETITEAPPGNKDLYSVLLENVNGKWLIFDINCL